MQTDFLQLVIATLLSSTVVATVLTLLFHRRITRAEEQVKAEIKRVEDTFTSQRAWKEKSVTELLGPLYTQFDRTKYAFDRWDKKNKSLEQNIIRQGDMTIRDLLLAKGHLIPPDLRDDAYKLIGHYDLWLETYEELRSGPHAHEEEFTFVYNYPRSSEDRFREAYKQMWADLYEPHPESK
jgi:hypothetical protein